MSNSVKYFKSKANKKVAGKPQKGASYQTQTAKSLIRDKKP